MGIGNNSGSHAYSGGHYAQAPNAHDCCFGDKKMSRWNVEAGVGPEFIVGGDALTGSQSHPGFTAPETLLEDVSMQDAYDTGYRAELGASYAVTPNRKITGQVYYAKAEGNDVAFGLQEDEVIRGQFSDYEAYGVEAGIRQYARPVRAPLINSFRPYVEGKLGAAYVEAMTLDNVRAGAAADPRTPTSLTLYEDSWVPTAAGLIGVETPLFKRMTIGVETGIRYTGKPKSDNTSYVAGTAQGDFNQRYAGINNGGDRFTVPLTIRGRYRF